MLLTQEVGRRSQCGYRHGDTPCPYPHGDMETLYTNQTWRHMETHGGMWRHVETQGDTQRHRDTPYKICSQIKTNIYDAISSLALIGPMS